MSLSGDAKTAKYTRIDTINGDATNSTLPGIHSRKSIQETCHNSHDFDISSTPNSKLLTMDDSHMKSQHEQAINSSDEEGDKLIYSSRDIDKKDDEEEDKEEDDDLTPLSEKQDNEKEIFYNFETNEQIARQELIQDMLERLKIAITFLLHEQSPLWNDDEEDEKSEDLSPSPHEQVLSSIYAKGTLSTSNLPRNDNKKGLRKTFSSRSMKSVNSSKSAPSLKSNNFRLTYTFQHVVTQYTQNAIMSGGISKIEQRLQALFNPKYIVQWKSLYKLWCQWLQYAKSLDNAQFIPKFDLHDEMEQNEQILQVKKIYIKCI